MHLKAVIILVATSLALCCAEAKNCYLIAFHKPAALLIADEAGTVLWRAEEPIDHPQECSVTSDGDILCAEKNGVVVIGLDQSIQWRFTNPPGTENSAASQLAPDRFLIAVEGPTKLREINRAGEVLKEIQLTTTAKKLHGQIRGVRKTPVGTYLVSFYQEGAYREYDEQGTVVRDFGPIPNAIGAIRLPNGNTLICNGTQVQELDQTGAVVWFYDAEKDANLGKKALPGGLTKLSNGNVVMKFYTSSKQIPALLEVTPNKKIVRKVSVPGYAKAGFFQVLTDKFKPASVLAR